jgi:hypothetical protein
VATSAPSPARRRHSACAAAASAWAALRVAASESQATSFTGLQIDLEAPNRARASAGGPHASRLALAGGARCEARLLPCRAASPLAQVLLPHALNVAMFVPTQHITFISHNKAGSNRAVGHAWAGMGGARRCWRTGRPCRELAGRQWGCAAAPAQPVRRRWFTQQEPPRPAQGRDAGLRGARQVQAAAVPT